MFSQKENFFVENKILNWSCIYESSKSIDEVKNIFNKSGKILIEKESSNSFSGIIKDFVMDYKGAGSSFMSTPGYLNESNKYNANFLVEFKEGKYKVTVNNIRLKGLELSFGVVTDNGIENIEQYALKSNLIDLKPRFIGRESNIINHSFYDLFNIKNYKIDDNW